jgi:hypothetical protein
MRTSAGRHNVEKKTMYVHFGKRPYGTCDVVPELFYVATWFFHINFLPLVPVGTHLVFGKKGSFYNAVPIPLSIKSILLAWARTAMFLGGVALSIMAIIALAEPHSHPAREFGVNNLAAADLLCIAFYALLMIYPRRRMPSYERACKLAELAGLSDTGWAALNVLYGRDPLGRPQKDGVLTVR